MKLLVMTLLALSTTFAQTITKKFVVDSFTDFGGRAYYSCDSVEDRTADFLEILGASNISVKCSGGFDHHTGWTREAFVIATFEVAQNGSYEEFELRSSDNCHLYKEIFSGVKKAFDFERVDRVRSCMRSNDSVRITGSVLK